MAKISLVKMVNGCLRPSLPTDEQRLRRWKVGDILELDLYKPRNGQFHRKAFALFQLVFENQDRYTNIEDLLVEIKLKTGHYQEHVTTKGRIIYVPKSISFSAMGEIEFEEFFSKAIDVTIKHFLPDKSEAEIRQYVQDIMSFV